MTANCPTPWKVRFLSRAQALSDAKRSRSKPGSKAGGQLRAYRCQCGDWHLTHIPKRQFKRNERNRPTAKRRTA